MAVEPCRWMPIALLAAALAACAGGRGSSGFDISEQQVIDNVLASGECGAYEGLTICAADAGPTTPTPPASATPTPTSVTPGLTTPTATPGGGPRIDTGLAAQSSIPCTPLGPNACVIRLAFSASAFPAGTTFEVAARRVEPNTDWRRAAPPVAVGPPGQFETAITFAPGGGISPDRLQFAVLAFVSAPPTLPAVFSTLAESEADLAFVTQALFVDVTDDGATATPTPDRTPQPPEAGPAITFYGLATADDQPLTAIAVDDAGRPIYTHSIGQGFSVVLEARPGTSRSPVGTFAVDLGGGLPDFQMLCEHDLGDGEPTVCDTAPPSIGGVPAVAALEFSNAPDVVNAINDMGCRVNDGTGAPAARSAGEACTRDVGGDFRFVDGTSTVQFCLPIAAAWAFPPGDTICAVRVRDRAGTVGFAQEIVVRIGPLPPTPTRTPTAPLPTPTATATAPPLPPEAGPRVTYFGVARADSQPLAPSAFDAMGRPIYTRPLGQGLLLVVEAQPGTSGRPVGVTAVVHDGGLPDLQMILSRPLGDGNPAVCDITAPDFGGVAATEPFAFGTAPDVVAAINDFGCRVNDGLGAARGRPSSSEACTRSDDGFGFGFVDPRTTIQYCLSIARAWAFPAGDTLVAAQVRDTGGTTGLPREIIVRVGDTPPVTSRTPAPSPTPTPSAPGSTAAPEPSPTPTATPDVAVGIGPVITYLGVARADNSPLFPTAVDPDGRPIYVRPNGQGMTLIIEARRGASGRAVGLSAFDPAGGAPDLQLLVSAPLGDGSPAVCDASEPTIGGVPATAPFEFGDHAVAAMNDLGCRVDDGRGVPMARVSSIEACTRSDAGFGFGFVDQTTAAQFCLPIAGAWAFPAGDTIVRARVRDTSGNPGPPRDLIVRVTDDR